MMPIGENGVFKSMSVDPLVARSRFMGIVVILLCMVSPWYLSGALITLVEFFQIMDTGIANLANTDKMFLSLYSAGFLLFSFASFFGVTRALSLLELGSLASLALTIAISLFLYFKYIWSFR